MNDPWYEMGQDAAHDGRSLRAILSDCETPYERAAAYLEKHSAASDALKEGTGQ